MRVPRPVRVPLRSGSLTSQGTCPYCSRSLWSVLTRSRKSSDWTACSHRDIKFAHWAERQRFQTTALRAGGATPEARSFLTGPQSTILSGHPLCGLAAGSPNLLLSPTEKAESVCTWGQFPLPPSWTHASITVWLSLACANVSGKNRKFRDGGKCLADVLSPEPGHLLCLRGERASK